MYIILGVIGVVAFLICLVIIMLSALNKVTSNFPR